MVIVLRRGLISLKSIVSGEIFETKVDVETSVILGVVVEVKDEVEVEVVEVVIFVEVIVFVEDDKS
jgi:hypothetical protein